MQLTLKQEEGLKAAVERFKNHERYTCISGYAGSGKSTLVKFIVQALPGIDPEKDICYCAYTGKAAQVLLKKGNKNVSTLHKLMYTSFRRADGSWARMLKTSIEYKVIVVDEVSMVPSTMWRELLSFRCYILALGDPFQLPPVLDEDDNGVLTKPHVFLDEVHRQAQESEIIRISMDIRAGKPLTHYDGEEVKILDRHEYESSMLLWADQVLAATNATRIATNNFMRELLGREGNPQDLDKVICLKNYWLDCANNQDPLVNGTIGFLKNPYNSYVNLRKPRSQSFMQIPTVNAIFVSDSNANFGNLIMDKKMIMQGEKFCDEKTHFLLSKSKEAWKIPKEFTYGYCITVHKAQGSSWEKVLILEENFPFSNIEHSRWVYTAITRAEEKAIIIKK